MNLIFDELISECIFTFARSSGKGGQNVNKVSTKVILQFSVENSRVLSVEEKKCLWYELQNRISKTGILQLSAGSQRSQLQNKDAVTLRFIRLIEKALQPETERIATKPTRASKQKRLDAKATRSVKKALRSRLSEEVFEDA